MIKRSSAIRPSAPSLSVLAIALYLAVSPATTFAQEPVLIEPAENNVAAAAIPAPDATQPAEQTQMIQDKTRNPVTRTAPIATKPAPKIDSVNLLKDVDRAPWLYKGSDIPQDAGWQFGTLKNGLRFAVRNNDVPAGQVSIRVRIDAGSMMENPDELGFAHFLEHLSFRGTDKVDDGEIKRTWQRLGATFGSDSNAQTTPSHTVYQLDLPSIDETKLDESFALLSGMMRSPRIDATTVNSERLVVLAELREAGGVQGRISDASRELLFAGTLLATRPTGGVEKTIMAGTPEMVSAFHARHYRPEKTVIAVAGDLPVDMLAAVVRKHFGDWQGKGPASAPVDFGKPDPKAPIARIMTEPTQPLMMTWAKVRPFKPVTDTVAYTQTLYHDYLALAVINRRLEKRARANASYLYAQVSQDKINRAADMTTISLAPLDKNWDKAITEVRAVIADALKNPPSAEDIAREARDIDAAIATDAANARNQAGSALVDDMVRAVDIGETVAAPADHVKLFRSSLPTATPKTILETTQRLFSGESTRLLLITPDAVAGGTSAMETKLASMAVSPVVADGSARVGKSKMTIANLPKLGAPGSLVSTTPVQGLGIDVLTLSNGVKAMIANNPIEPDKVRVTVRFGGGRGALSPDKPNLLWSGNYAILSSGIGTLREDDLDQITNGRNLGLGFGVDDDAFEFTAETTPTDLADQLRLIATKMEAPGWDPQTVRRARAAMLLGYATQSASPVDVLQRDLSGIVRNNDPRWASPSKAQIEALTPESFKAFWEPLLKSGAIEVQLFGDMQSVDYTKLLNETFGALKPRMPAVITPASRAIVASKPTAAPVKLSHSGDDNQAAAVLSWPTTGGIADAAESRKLDVLAAIMSDRLFDQLRSKLGAAYSPIVISDWPMRATTGGQFFVESQLKPSDTDVFFKVVKDIATDLATNLVSKDELDRATKPLQEQVTRASSGNQFWMLELKGASNDERRVTALRRYLRDIASTTPEDIKTLAAKYLKPESGFGIVVLPEKQVGGTVTAATPNLSAPAKTGTK